MARRESGREGEEMSDKVRSKGTINNYVAHRIRELRMARKITSQEMARRTGIAPGSYSCLENGWYKINLDNLFKILQALGAKVVEVWPQTRSAPGKRIDENYLHLAVTESMESRPREITLDDIFEVVSSLFGIGKEHLHSQARSWERLNEARAVCAMLVEEMGHIDTKALRSSMGFSSSAMVQLLQRYEDQLADDPALQSKLDESRRQLGLSEERPAAVAAAGA